MKQFNLMLAGIFLACTFQIHAQISQGGQPVGQIEALSLENVPVNSLPQFDLERIMLEDEADEKAGNYPKIGRILPVSASPQNSGEWTYLDNGSRLWRLAVKSRDAMGLSMQFENFGLPEGAQLFIYSPDYQHVIGAFTDFNNHKSGVFSTQLIPADEVIIEYLEPSGTQTTIPFELKGVFHAYRMVPGAPASQARDFGDSDPCQVNVNCSEGNNWQDEKRGVVRIFVIEGAFGGWCSGSLVNNTAQDCTPYVLTALHCGLNSTTANLNQWVFYFNYESSGCANGTQGQVPNNTMTGCARIADSGDGGGDNGSDYMLVEINNNVPQGYNPYYNGWRRNNVTSSSGVSIHHPSGDIKKISTYSSNLQSVTWGGPAGTHWMVTWSNTANGHGVTEGGSSGSPIFDNQGHIIGTLTGGSSFCTNPTSPDLYGKMSYHWNSNPGDNLSQYLDPGNTGVTSLSGTNQPCSGAESGGDCVVIPPYPTDDPCVIAVVAEDPFCCDDEWDSICEDAYLDCTSGGVDCEAGDVNVSLSQNICPGEFGIFNATGVDIPAGGGYAVQFLPDGGTGANGTGFSITGVQPLPFEFDAGVNGILAGAGLPPMAGQWLAIGFVYTDSENATTTVCSITDLEVTYNFLSSGSPECDGSGGDCAVIPPYPADDPCVIFVLADDPFCCDDEWDSICEDAYIECLSGGSDCEAGDVNVSLSQNICPGEFGIFNATGVEIPAGGGYAVQFLPDGGTGANGTGFLISGVQPLPFEFDAGVNGILATAGFPPMSGQWVSIGFVYTDPDNAAASACSITELEVTYNFLSSSSPECDGTGTNNDDCANATLVTPGVHPFSTVGATTDGPDQPGSDCDAFQQTNVNNDVWFEYTATCDGTSSFSTCNSADFDTRIAVYPGGQCPPSAASLILCNDDYPGCDDYTSYLEWDVVEGATYLLRIGGYSPADFGTGTFELIENCDGGPVDPTNDESFEGDFPPACWSIIDADGDGQNWFKYGSADPGSPLFGVAQDGNFTAASASWMGSPLTPNNYLVTPQLSLGNNEVLVYWVAAQDPDWAAENYAVFLSTTGNAATDFTVNLFEETLVNDTWMQRTIDLSAYAGQDVYLAFRHFNVTDEFYIKIDNVTLPGDIIPCTVEPPGDECLDWVSPTPTTGWPDFNNQFGGAPANEGDGCPVYAFTTFQVWMSEAYAMDNVVEGTSYTFSHCEGPGAGTWVPEYTIIAPSGAIDAFGAGDGDGCSITWIASESGTYLIVINEAGNCGNGAQIENGYPSITCNDDVTSINDYSDQESYMIFPNPNNGQFTIQLHGVGGIAHVDILEVSGKVVQSAQINFTDNALHNVDLGSRASGMYFVRITMNDNIFVERVVVH